MRALKYFVNEATESLLRSWRSAMLAVLTITAGLFALGFFLIINSNVQRVVGRWSESAEMSVYLKDDVTADQLKEVDALVAQSGLAAHKQYVSKTAAIGRFRQDFPDLAGAADRLERNPFPASVEIRIGTVAGKSASAVDGLATSLAGAAGVADVRYDRRWLTRLGSMVTLFRAIGFAIVGLLGIAAALTVANVVRLAAYARRDEIEIMQLVGAPFAFIRGPFVAEGVLQGGLGRCWRSCSSGPSSSRVRLARPDGARGFGVAHSAFLPASVIVVLLAGAWFLAVSAVIVARSFC